MRPNRYVGLALLIVALGAGCPSAFGGDSPAEAALRTKGLTKTGRVLVDLDAEKPVLAKMKEVRGIFAVYASAADKQAAVEQLQVQAVELEQQRAMLQANISALNQQIAAQNSSMGGGRYARAMRSMGPTPLQIEQRQETAAMNEAAALQKAAKAQIPSAKDKAALDDEVKKKGEAFKVALTELRPMVDEVSKKYETLNADESIKKSLADLEKAVKVKITIGPSETFAAAMKELDQAERRFLGKRPATPAKAKAKAKTATTTKK